MNLKPEDFWGWAPFRFRWAGSQPAMDWCFIGEQQFKEPFFDQTLNMAMRRPFSLLFRRETSMDALCELAESVPGLPPTAFIFHMSRCGSTLVSQMLAALDSSIVISEAPPIDQVLRAQLQHSVVDESTRTRWVRGVVNVLGRKRTGRERHYFIKFDSWHILQQPLILKAFPEVPWIFLYRDPVEVMVSQHRQCGAQMMPGVIAPHWLGLESARPASLEEYCAQVLGGFCSAAAAWHAQGRGRMVQFTELPEAVTGSLAKHFGLNLSPAEIAKMHQAAKFNAKTPSLNYEADSDEKQREASADIRRLAERWVGGPYAKLEELRAAQTGG